MTRHYERLDGLRGVAALAVAIGHAATNFSTHIRFLNTTLAVDLFFMLSAFVLMHAYSKKLQSDNFFTPYIIARIIRLYPLVFAGSILGLVAFYAHGGRGASGVVLAAASSVLMPTSNVPMFSLNPPLWSLFFEMIASALFGLGLWRSGSWTANVAMSIVLGIAAVLMIIHRGSIDAGWSISSLHYGFVRVLYGFSVGTVIYQAHISGRFSIKIPYPLAVIVLVCSLFSPPHPFIQIFSVIFAYPLILSSALSSGRTFSIFRLSGDISYPLYVTHYPVIIILLAVTTPAAAAIAFLPAACITAWVFLKIYDEPVRRMFRRLARKSMRGRFI